MTEMREGLADIARTITTGERAGFDTARHLEHAQRQAEERNLKDVLIIDADAHHYETASWPDVVKYIEDPVMRHHAEQGDRIGRRSLLNQYPGNQFNSGRLTRYIGGRFEQHDPSVPRDVSMWRRMIESVGIDYQVVFPTPLLELGLHPDADVEVALAWAYSRWLTEELLPHDARLKTLVYLPFNSPGACMRFVEYFAEMEPVVGFMINAARYKAVHHNDFIPIYRAVEERGMPLCFHAHFYRGRMFEGMNKFISVHALGFEFFNMVHMTNWLVNGLPERFPDLKVIWIENGLAWLPFMMQRLDNEYMMRSSEAPLLRKPPSEYMRENFYYTTQPLETTNLDALELTMKMINAETQVLFSSDYPHWDFNLPSLIWDLPFLTETTKRRILGENAAEVFGIK